MAKAAIYGCLFLLTLVNFKFAILIVLAILWEVMHKKID